MNKDDAITLYNVLTQLEMLLQNINSIDKSQLPLQEFHVEPTLVCDGSVYGCKIHISADDEAVIKQALHMIKRELYKVDDIMVVVGRECLTSENDLVGHIEPRPIVLYTEITKDEQSYRRYYPLPWLLSDLQDRRKYLQRRMQLQVVVLNQACTQQSKQLTNSFMSIQNSKDDGQDLVEYYRYLVRNLEELVSTLNSIDKSQLPLQEFKTSDGGYVGYKISVSRRMKRILRQALNEVITGDEIGKAVRLILEKRTAFYEADKTDPIVLYLIYDEDLKHFKWTGTELLEIIEDLRYVLEHLEKLKQEIIEMSNQAQQR